VAVSTGSAWTTSLQYATAATANYLVQRDSNANISFNNQFANYNVITTAGTTTALTAASAYWQKFTGSANQTITMPDATTMPLGAAFVFDNDSTGTITINDNGGTLVDSVPAGAIDIIFLESNLTAAGSWGKYSWLPANYNFTTTTADFGSVNITTTGTVTATGGVAGGTF
jgi:hypothetical protein